MGRLRGKKCRMGLGKRRRIRSGKRDSKRMSVAIDFYRNLSVPC
jgi:hypothetical protein